MAPFSTTKVFTRHMSCKNLMFVHLFILRKSCFPTSNHSINVGRLRCRANTLTHCAVFSHCFCCRESFFFDFFSFCFYSFSFYSSACTSSPCSSASTSSYSTSFSSSSSNSSCFLLPPPPFFFFSRCMTPLPLSSSLLLPTPSALRMRPRANGAPAPHWLPRP